MKSKTIRLDEYQMSIIKDSLFEYLEEFESTYGDKYYIVEELEREVKKIIKKFDKEEK